MKKNVFYLMSIALIMFSFISVMKTEAQVTIGEAAPPHPASILDLRTSKGLLLSKAHLENAAIFQLSADKTKEAVGMIIYNTNHNMKDGYGEGLYVWNGSRWDLLEESDAPAIDCSGAPTIISITGFSGTVKLNDSFDVSCNASTSGKTTYTWTIPQGLEVSGDRNGQTITLIAKTAGSYNGGDLSCAVVNACGGGSSIAGASQVLIVKDCTDKPSTPGSITFSPTTVNKGATFTASISPVAGATSYQWWFNGQEVLPQTTSPSKEITASVAGTIAVKVVAVNDCGESNAITQNITVNGCAGAPSTPGEISIPATVNMGAKFTASIKAVAGATSYKWWFNNQELSETASPSKEITASVTGNIAVKVVAKNDCGESNAITKNITVIDCTGAPSGGSISLSSPSIKKDDNFTATANVTTSGSTTYAWTIPSKLTVSGSLTSRTISLKATEGGEHNVSCKVTNDCGNTTINYTIKVVGQSSVDGYETYCYSVSTGKTCWMTENSRLGSPDFNAYTKNGAQESNVGYYYSYKAATTEIGGQYTACPKGWTLPTQKDFSDLQDYLKKSTTSYDEKKYWLRDKDKDGFYYAVMFMGWNQYSGFFGNQTYIVGHEDDASFLDYEPHVVPAVDDHTMNSPYSYALSVRCVKKID